MIWQQFLSIAVWTLLVSLLVALAGVAVPKVWALGVDRAVWVSGWLAGSMTAGLLFAAAWTALVRRGMLDAALELDRRFGLKERVSSSLALRPDEADTEAGRALVEDARRRVRDLDVGERFPVVLGRRAWLPLVPAAAVFLVAQLVPDAVPPEARTVDAATVAVKKQVQTSAEQLKRRLAERRAAAEQEGLEEAARLLKDLEQGLDGLAKRGDDDRKQALVKLNDLSQDLKQRRAELGGRDEIRKQLKNLVELQRGPADRLAEAMKAGDFPAALEEVRQLQQQLRDGKLDAQQQQQLAEQLKQMEDQLRQLAEAHEQAREELQRQIQQKLDAGDLAGAGKLQQQLDRLDAQNEQMQGLQNLANQLGQAAQQLQAGDGRKAADQLDQIVTDLEQLEQELAELEMLDGAIDRIAQAKDAMNCGQCQGAGCGACEGDQPGAGLGRGRGMGARPEAETDSRFYESRVRTRPGAGRAVIVGSVRGPNVAGEAREEIKSAIERSAREEADPLVGQRLPRAEREQAKQYFDAFREGRSPPRP